MIESMLRELSDSANATLGDWIEACAVARNAQLRRDFTVYNWWQTDSELLKISFPLVSFAWDATVTTLRNGDARTSVHRVIQSYAFRSADMAEIQRHIVILPEAVLRWLDSFPVLSRSPGATILAVGVDATGRSVGDIRITHGPVFDKKGGAPLAWSVDFDYHVATVDKPLPSLVTDADT